MAEGGVLPLELGLFAEVSKQELGVVATALLDLRANGAVSNSEGVLRSGCQQ
ncbi:MAG: hypothetical protein OK454_11370 [Thaumarchaeota archaeon]|nr:hypothetical protein [Nitrososphaerota archaeon]